MSQSAKIFINGRSQAVRLPATYRFDCKEVYIRQDPKTGDVILSRKPENWDDFLELVKKTKIPTDFMADREDSLAQERDVFNEQQDN